MQKFVADENKTRQLPRLASYWLRPCTLAVVRRSQKFFAPLQTPFSGVQDGQNLISWRWSLPSHTDPVWWRLMHAISSYCGNRPTNKQTHRQDRLQYTVPLAGAQCNKLSCCDRKITLSLSTLNAGISQSLPTKNFEFMSCDRYVASYYKPIICEI